MVIGTSDSDLASGGCSRAGAFSLLYSTLVVYQTPPMLMTGDLVSVVSWNQVVIDIRETAPAKVEAAYDWLQGNADGNGIERVGKFTTGALIVQGGDGIGHVEPEAEMYIRFDDDGRGIDLVEGVV